MSKKAPKLFTAKSILDELIALLLSNTSPLTTNTNCIIHANTNAFALAHGDFNREC